MYYRKSIKTSFKGFKFPKDTVTEILYMGFDHKEAHSFVEPKKSHYLSVETFNNGVLLEETIAYYDREGKLCTFTRKPKEG